MKSSELRASSPKTTSATTFATIAVWTLVYLLVIGGLQFYTSYPNDTDTAYHAAVGSLIRKYGLLHSFPWTTFSLMANQYADKELLFHLLFVPLSSLNYVTAARIVGTIGGTGVLLAIYLVLRREGVKHAGLWALVPLTSSAFFVYRLALVRPHLLSIPLALLLLWAAVRCRLWCVAVIAIIYPWAYVAFWQIPLLLLFSAEVARFLAGEKPRWEPVTVVVAGLIIGVALHPNTLNLLQLNWVQMSVLKNSWQLKEGFDLGREFLPPSTAAWKYILSPLIIMVVISTSIVLCKRTKNTMMIAFILVAIGFCILTARTMRFTEYFAPFAVASLALTSRLIPFRYLPHSILIVTFIYNLQVGTIIDITRLSKRSDDMPSDVAISLQQLVPPGVQIFTPDWQSTGTFMLALPERRFIVALDPTFFFAKDPDLYRIWYRVSREAPPDTVDIIREKFRSRYVLFNYIAFRDKFVVLFNRLSTEPRVKTLLRKDGLVLFDLGDSGGLPGNRTK